MYMTIHDLKVQIYAVIPRVPDWYNFLPNNDQIKQNKPASKCIYPTNLEFYKVPNYSSVLKETFNNLI